MAYERYVPEFSDKDGNIYGVMDEEGRESIECLEENVSQVKDNVYTYKEVSGEIVTVDDAVAEAVKQMRIEIAPVQDLHGYDHPWPAGGGKNKLEVTATTQTVSGVTFTVNNDGTIQVSGTNTSSGNISIIVGNVTLPQGIYTVSTGNPTGAANDTHFLNVDPKETGSSDNINIPTTYTFTDSAETTHTIKIYVRSGKTVNALYKPMVESGSTATAYEPYSNICPITGWTGAKVARTGGNIWDEQWEVGTINADTGENAYNSGMIRMKNRMRVIPGATYYLHIGSVSGSTNVINACFYDKYGNWLTKSYVGGYYNSTFVVPSGAYYFRCSFNTAYGASYKNDISINYPSSDHDYHTGGENTPIIFPSEAGTVYGGTLTVNQYGTGTLIVDSGRVDLGSLDWEYAEGDARFQASFSGYKKPADDLTPINALCEMYKVVGAQNTYTTDYSIGANSGSDILVVKNTQYSDGADFKTAMSGVYLVYELEVTTSYALSAPEVNLLLGLNNVWADTGDILSMLYATPLYNDVRYANRVYETVENQAVATFSDGAESVPMKLTAGIDPVQDLHGYDHPWPAGGGKNLLDLSNMDTSSLNGVTFSKSSEGIVTVGGNATSTAYKQIYIGFPTENGVQYTLTGCPSGGETNKYRMTVAGYGYDFGSGYTFIGDGNAHNISIDVYTGYPTSGSTLTFKPMIVKGSTVGEFAPYSNICPITGWTGAKIWDDPVYAGTIAWNQLVQNGDFISGQKWNANLGTVSVANEKATVTRTSSGTTLALVQYNVYGTQRANHIFLTTATLTAPKNVVAGFYVGAVSVGDKNVTANTKTSYAFISKANSNISDPALYCYCDRATALTTGESVVFENVQTFDLTAMFGSTIADAIYAMEQATAGSGVSWFRNLFPKDYYAYDAGTETCVSAVNGNPYHKYEIAFPSSAGIVYGGALTVNRDGTGTLVVNNKGVTITGTEVEGVSSGSATDYSGGKRISTIYNDAKYAQIASNPPNVISDKLKSMSRDKLYSDADSVNGVSVGDNNVVVIRYAGASTTEEAKTALNANPVQIVYELAIPITYNMTAVEVAAIITTLKGLNNVWADTGDILSIDYPADTKLYINKQIAINARLLEMIITANHEEAMIATKAYNAGDLLIVNSKLYKASTSIANGATLTEGTNVTETTVAAEIAALA